MNSLQKYKKLFFSTFKLSASTFGGGFVIISLMRKKFVEKLGWIEEDEMMDLTAIAQSSPGAIAVNVGCVFPSCVIVMTLAYIYYRFRGLNMVQGILAGLRPAVIAMIASAGISLLIMALYGQRTLPNDLASLDLIAAIIFVIGIIVLRKWKPNPLWVMAGSGFAGIILYSLV